MGIFIGREAALGALLSDLTGPSTRTIADIHGLGGMGKTTLKAELLMRLDAAGAMIPFFLADENAPRGDVAEFLGTLVASFRQVWRGPTATFGRLRRHRERLRDLKAAITTGSSPEILGRGLDTTLSGSARRATLAGMAGTLSERDDPDLTGRDDPDRDGRDSPDLAGRGIRDPLAGGFTFLTPSTRWTPTLQQDYEAAVAGWTRDHEDRELLLDPLAVLTRDFLDDLAEFLCPETTGLGGLLGGKRQLPQTPLRVLVAIDSFEAVDQGTQEWLLTHLLPALEHRHFEDRPLSEILDLRLLLCGRHALRNCDPLRRWDVFTDRIRSIDLDRFDSNEVRAYLEARGLPADRTAEALAETHGLPYLLALWCDSAGKDRTLAIGRAASRVFWWKTPQQVRWLKSAAFLETVDRDALEILLADGSQEQAYAWLAPNDELCCSEGAALVIHPIIRTLVAEALTQESPTQAAEFGRRARLATRVAALRHEIGPAVFERLLALAPLRWFNLEVLRELIPTQATDCLALTTTSAVARIEGLPHPDCFAVVEALRDDLMAYLALAQPARLHEAVARIEALDRRRKQSALADRERSAAQAQSLARDASVARKRAMTLDARMLALQAREKAAQATLRRAEAAELELTQPPAPAPWWALFMLRSRPPVASMAERTALRQELDLASSQLAEIRADLAGVLVEVSEAAREADALEAQAASAEVAADQVFAPLL